MENTGLSKAAVPDHVLADVADELKGVKVKVCVVAPEGYKGDSSSCTFGEALDWYAKDLYKHDLGLLVEFPAGLDGGLYLQFKRDGKKQAVWYRHLPYFPYRSGRGTSGSRSLVAGLIAH